MGEALSLYNVQHVDRNISPADYRQFPANTLLITKIFPTLQGEGPWAGHPSVFVRLAGCDKGSKTSCEFCDSFFDFDQGKVMTFDEIVEQIVEYAPPGFPLLVVITGGEPMIQDNLTDFIQVLASHKTIPFKVQIESNGDRLAKGYKEKFYNSYLVVSPKVNPTKQTYPNLSKEVYDVAYALKFVVDARIESAYNKLPDYAYEFHRRPGLVYVSPMTIYKRATRKDEVPSLWDSDLIDHQLTSLNYQYAADLAMKHGFRVSIQSHLLYGVE